MHPPKSIDRKIMMNSHNQRNIDEKPSQSSSVILKERCAELKITYHVVPGSSWGDLPVDLQK
jgi:hypothetical protein